MAHVTRKRMLHPGFHRHPKVCRNIRDARLLLTCIMANADDEGYADGDPLKWKSECFSTDADVSFINIETMLQGLAKKPMTGAPLIEFIWSKSGERMIRLPGWSEAQWIRKELRRDSNRRKSLRDNPTVPPCDTPVTDQQQDSITTDAPIQCSSIQYNRNLLRKFPGESNGLGYDGESGQKRPDSPSRDSDQNRPESRDRKALSIAERVRRHDLEELRQIMLKRYERKVAGNGKTFDDKKITDFVGWPFIQSVSTLGKTCSMDPRILLQRHVPPSVNPLTYIPAISRGTTGRPALRDGEKATAGWDVYMRRPRSGINTESVGDVLEQMRRQAAAKGAKK